MHEDNTSTAPSPIEANYYVDNEPRRSWTERNGFPHWVMFFVWFFIAFIGFNIVGGIVAVVGILFTVADFSDMDAIMQVAMENVNIMFWANTSGQVLVMALGTIVALQLSAAKGDRKNFLRFNFPPKLGLYSLAAAVLTVAVFPTVNFLAWINSFVPAPQSWLDMQESMAQLISKFLKSENTLLLGLLHIGLVPAVCEEIMFRGYLQRSMEKSVGVWGAIFITGFLFGAYHLQITNLLPLAFLGIMMCYVTYVSNSIIPAIVAHLVNNGGQVIASSYYPEMLDETITPQTEMPWLLIFVSIVVSSAIVYGLFKTKVSAEYESI